MAGAGGGGRVSVAPETGGVVPFVGGEGWGHGTTMARVVALGGAGAVGAGPWGVVAPPRGAEAVQVQTGHG